MSVDTKGCIITKEKDPFKVVNVINGWWNSRPTSWRRRRIESFGWSTPRAEVSGAHDALSVYFQIKGEDRRLYIPFDCDCDLANYDEIEGESCVWLSLGHWGSSVELMESLLIEFRKQEWVERCYIDKNDSDEEGFKEVTTS